MALRIVECRSPNQDARPEGTKVDILVLHYTGMRTADEALSRLCDPDAKVSAHYTVAQDGRVYRHVPEERRAWHAGISYWAGERNVNARSIGIELVNPGHEFGYEPFPETQIAALIDLVSGIRERHAIPQERVIGHSDVAPARKQDPGELFPWRELAEFDIGIWPDFSRRLAPNGGAEKALARIGYGLPPEVDVPMDAVVAAFQRHWRPSKVDGAMDDETAYRLAALAAALP
jgi:N-acetylmuramoyl-L-alanine amidase